MTLRIEPDGPGLSAYRGAADARLLDAVATAAEALRGARVLHLNATPYGGGVAELLRSTIPVLRSLGIAADWRVIEADDDFFSLTKALHNGLQGGAFAFANDARSLYEKTCASNSGWLSQAYDVIVVHDPQPAGVLAQSGAGRARWVWRSHIDTSTPNPEAWGFLRPFLRGFDAAVFTLHDFVLPDLPIERVDVIPPAIDPLSAKNTELAPAVVEEVVAQLGIPVDVPIVSQISRFDPWKDPMGVIEAYRLARGEAPPFRLVLAGSMAADDPQATAVYEEVVAASEADARIHVLTDLSDREVNALQRASAVVLQKSLREGFGLVVSEAMWKGVPVVAGRVGGIPLQMADGAGGLLVDEVGACADAIVTLLRDRALADELGRRGRVRVQDHFLLPRLLLNELSLLGATLAGANGAEWSLGFSRDPACGLALPARRAPDGGPVVGLTSFCSNYCRTRFNLGADTGVTGSPASPSSTPLEACAAERI